MGLKKSLLIAALVPVLAVVCLYPTVHHRIKVVHVLLTLASTGVVPHWALDMITPHAAPGVTDARGVTSEDKFVGDVLYRTYTPRKEKDPKSVMVWVHGGGFVLGHVQEVQIDEMCRKLSFHGGIKVMSVEYRKAPEHSFLAAVSDVRLVVEAAKEQGFEQVALGGESAGASISLGVALKMPKSLNFLTLVYPGLEHGFDEALMDEAWVLSRRIVDWFRSHHLLPDETEAAEVERFAQFLKYADSHVEEVKMLPEVNLVSAGLDPLILGVRKLESKFEDLGVQFSHDHYKGSFHGFICLGVPGADEALERMAHRVRDAFAKRL